MINFCSLKNVGVLTVFVFCVLVLVGTFVSTLHLIQLSYTAGRSSKNKFVASKILEPPQVNCSYTCPANYPVPHETDYSSADACPEYFRWIHEDVRPWKDTGITKEMVESGQEAAHIRVVVVKGRVYVKKSKCVFQTRDVFTVWGIIQLLRLYPGRVPDFDMMFECGDRPVIKKSDYGGSTAAAAAIPPPLFHYCGDDSTLDIVFPDWSFWGWPEINVKPWEILRKALQDANNRVKWRERENYAHWRGNTYTSVERKDLMKCNLTDKQDWKARLYELVTILHLMTQFFLDKTKLVGLQFLLRHQFKFREDWKSEREGGFKTTDVASQCTHRYKIYIEGVAWSVGEKYILACDSMSLLMKPHYYDFFTRSLMPTVHYWPINDNDKCRSIKFAVDWGNSHIQKAQEIGKTASKFIQEELKMKYVYDYMFHLLYRYASLLKYQPVVPEGAIEVCSETLACFGKGLKKKFKIYSMVNGPSNIGPCTLPPPYEPASLQSILDRKENLEKQVEMWEENQYLGET